MDDTRFNIRGDETYVFCIKSHPKGFFKNCHYSLMRCDNIGDIIKKYYISYKNNIIKLDSVGGDSGEKYHIFYGRPDGKRFAEFDDNVDNHFITVGDWLERNFPQKMTIKDKFEVKLGYYHIPSSHEFKKDEQYEVDVEHFRVDPLNFALKIKVGDNFLKFSLDYEEFIKKFVTLAEMRRKKLEALGEFIEYPSSVVIKLSNIKKERRLKLNKLRENERYTKES